MLKMYLRGLPHGGTPGDWEENWNDVRLDEALRFCALDPLRPLLDHYARPGTTMLEGGCGQGQYVAFYAARGVRVVGLDFAGNLLTRLHARDQRLMLAAGDVAALPFRDQSFDVYYSGGVVEHFEAGAEASLLEARRVLRPKGVLLISVPYFSPLRRVLSLTKKRDDWKRVSRPARDEPQERTERQFFQYAYTQREFRALLAAAGLRVLTVQGYAIVWGLYDIPFVQRIADALATRLRSGNHASPKVERTHVDGNGQPPALLKRLVVAEDDRVPIAGLVVRALRWTCANMLMYVCMRHEDVGAR